MSIKHMLKVLVLVAFLSNKGNANECIQRSFGPDRIVCVCNSTYCDTTPDPNPKIPENGTYYWYISTPDGFRLNFFQGRTGYCPDCCASRVLNIDTTKRYQTIFGFGGAFTDATGINIKKLSPATQDQLIRAYYDPKVGSKYSIGRIPIGGTDFSTRMYTYDEYDNDVELELFSLTPEDYDYKIPFLKRATELNPEVKFVSAIWSCPKWMKTNNDYYGHGFLKKEYYQVYANYLLKFLKEYKKNGIDVWGISTGNEPSMANSTNLVLGVVGWSPETLGEWIANNLGPTLANSAHNDTKIFTPDDETEFIMPFVQSLFENKNAEAYASGISMHWYSDDYVSPKLPVILDQIHNSYKDKFILMSEASIGSEIPLMFAKLILGDWTRAQRYILSIINYLNHWTIGWIDWNLALDKSGGPNYLENYLDACIIVNPETDEFFKQPMFFAIKHVSKFIDKGSVIISITDDPIVKATAAVTPSNEVVIVLYNTSPISTDVVLKDANKKDPICLELPPLSINTVIYAQ